MNHRQWVPIGGGGGWGGDGSPRESRYHHRSRTQRQAVSEVVVEQGEVEVGGEVEVEDGGAAEKFMLA